MGFLDDLKKWAKPYSDDEDEYYDDYDDEADDSDAGMEEEESAPPRRGARRSSTEPATSYSSPISDSRREGNSRIVNINATTQLQVVLVRPENYENVSDIAKHLRERHAVLLNLETTDKKVACRLVDFLSGCAYALDGKIKKVAASAYLITPYNVDIVGDLVSELENKDMYF